MKEFSYTITDKDGVHARPAGQLVKTSAKFKSSIRVYKNGKEANLKSIFSLMALNVKCGETLVLNIEGEDEAEAAVVIEDFFKSNM